MLLMQAKARTSSRAFWGLFGTGDLGCVCKTFTTWHSLNHHGYVDGMTRMAIVPNTKQVEFSLHLNMVISGSVTLTS